MARAARHSRINPRIPQNLNNDVAGLEGCLVGRADIGRLPPEVLM